LRPSSNSSSSVATGLSGGTTNATTLLNKTVNKGKTFDRIVRRRAHRGDRGMLRAGEHQQHGAVGAAFCTAAAASAPAAAGRFSMVMRWPRLRPTISA
jgi:hypothetical protein